MLYVPKCDIIQTKSTIELQKKFHIRELSIVVKIVQFVFGTQIAKIFCSCSEDTCFLVP